MENKMLRTLGMETVIERGHRLACESFGRENVVVAIPAGDAAGPLYDELQRIGAAIFYHGMVDERDVLQRFWRCAHKYRWHPSSVIHRWTPDDFRKVPGMCRAVANGYRYPVVLGGEAFTLAMLDEANAREKWFAEPKVSWNVNTNREHISYALFPTGPLDLPPNDEVWSIDDEASLAAARRIVEGEAT